MTSLWRAGGSGSDGRGAEGTGAGGDAAEDGDTRQRESVVIRSPEELIASIPSMMGFPPAPGSVVIVCCREGGGSGPVLRVDVPGLQDDEVIPTEEELREGCGAEPEGGIGATDGIDPGPAQMIARFCSRERVESAHLVVVRDDCTTDHVAGMRAKDAAAEFQYWFGLLGTEIEGAYGVESFAAGQTWVDLFGMVHGIQLDPDSTQIAAVHAFQGRVRADSREQIERLYATRDVDACDVQARCPEWMGVERAEDSADREARAADREARAARDVARHDAAARRLGVGDEVDDDELAAIGRSLLDIGVRDEVYRALAQRDPADDDGRHELWWTLARRRPSRERSMALLLLGAASYFAGRGVHAMCALEAAVEADDRNSLARLLLKGLSEGIAPDRLRRASVP